MKIEELQHLGLSDKETRLYEAALLLGPAKAQQLVAASGLNRGTLYDIARSLFAQGLLSTTQRRGVTYFVAQSPKKYLADLKRRAEAVEELLPVIEQGLHKHSQSTRFRYVEGREGIKALYEEALDVKSKEILMFVSIQEMINTVGIQFVKDFVRRRVRRHINIRALKDPAGEISPEQLQGHSTESDADLLMETRLCKLPTTNAAMIMIFDGTVAFMSSSDENFGYLITSAAYAEFMRSVFEFSWRAS